MNSAAAPLLRVIAGFACTYAATLAVLWWAGRSPSIPWTFMPFLVFVSAPFGVAMYALCHVSPRRDSPIQHARKGACVAAGLVATYFAREFVVWLIAAIAVTVVTRGSWTRPRCITAAAVFLAVTLGYAAIWNLNYLFALITAGRVLDPWMVTFDLKALSYFTPAAASYHKLFPLVTNPVGFRLFENAYVLLFPEVITVALITVQRGGHAATRWLCAFFLMYAIALAVFLAAPVLGPPIYAPASFDSQLKTTLTFRLMDGMATEYRQLLTGGGLSGFGYFVAVPSLHVAAAVLMQGMMRPYPYVYWTWLPANVLLVLSTVVLGYHYILDVPAGYCITLLIRRYASFEPLEGPSARMIEAIGPGADTRSYRPAGAV